MAELSQETQAIIATLKAEGDLIRNSGTNSVRAVNIKLDKFQGLFDAISTNIVEQTSMLREQLALDTEALEKSRTNEQLSELGGGTTSNDSKTNDNSESADKFDAAADKFVEGAEKVGNLFTLKNMAIAAAGGFVLYNFLKGFIDEKTGGGWTNFESNFGRFASELGSVDIKGTFDEMRESMEEMKNSMNEMKGAVETFIETVTDMGVLAGLLLTAITGLGTLNQGLRLLNNLIERNNKKLGGPDPENAPRRTLSQRIRNALGGYDEFRQTPEPEQTRTAPRRTPLTQTQRNALGGYDEFRAPSQAPARATPRPYDDAILRQQRNPAPNFQTRSVRPAIDGRRDNGQFASQAEIEQAFKDARMRRIFLKVVKGLGALGIVLSVVEMVQLYNILNAPSDPNDPNYVSDEDKISALGSTIGGFVGAAGGLAAGASVGAFAGPWGALILGAIGAGLGAWGGGYIGELIAKWAFDEAVTSNDTAKNAAMTGSVAPSSYMGGGYEDLSQQDYVNMYGPGGTAYGTNNTPDYMQYLDPNYSPTGGSGSATYGGRGTSYERPGERMQYIRRREGEMLDALIMAHQANKDREADIRELQEYLGLTDTGRSAQLAAVGQNANGSGGTVVLNSPVTNVSAPMSMVNGGNQAAVTNVSMGGGGGGPSLSPYGMTSGLVY